MIQTPANTYIPYARQDISDEDIKAVIEVLRSDFLTQGPRIPQFENAIRSQCHASFAAACNSATSALHLTCMALGLGPGDYLWTSPISFVASANCGLYCGAAVDFVDIDPQTFTMSPTALEQKLKIAEKDGTLPKIVIPVHMCGQSCDMAAIKKLSERYNFHIIEDASHALGGLYQKEPIGNCRYSDACVFSFHAVKIIATAEGGMITTNNQDLHQKLVRLRSHGITRDEALMTAPSDGPWYYQQLDLGYNYRITDLQAALGVSQLQRLPDFIKQRNRLADRYDKLLSDGAIITPYVHPDCYSSFHLYVIQLNLSGTNHSHRLIFEQLRASNIGVNLHYIPIHLQPYYQELGFQAGQFREAENYYQKSMTLPLYPGMSLVDQDYVIDRLNSLLN